MTDTGPRIFRDIGTRYLSPIQRLANHSSVALLCSISPAPHILMIKRAERAGDPWSGDMAFPGGRRSPSDQHHIDTALRELHEEVGLHISSRPVLSLNTVWTKSHNTLRPMAIHPYVFEVDKPLSFELSHEVSDAVWIPVEIFKNSPREHFPWKVSHFKLTMPCFYYRKFRIWGLSLKMIDNLMATDYFARLSGK